MKKIQKTYDIYNFDELDKEIQEKLIEEEKEAQTEFYYETFLQNDMEDEAKRLLHEYFGDKAEFENVYYSLSWQQGDGAMIEFNTYYYGKYVEVRHSGYYYHARCFSINTYELTDKQEEQLKKKIIAMNEELEKIGWGLIDYEPDMESALDFLRDRQYLKDGSVF